MKSLQSAILAAVMAAAFCSFTVLATAPHALAEADADEDAQTADGSVTVPAGTVLLVRLVDPVSSRDAAGKRFAAKLDANLAAGGETAVKAGTTVYGTVGSAKQAGRVAGRSKLELSVTEIVVAGTPVPVVTGGVSLVGKGSGKKTVGGAAVGAGLGATREGGNRNDVGRGAAIGAAASLLSPGQTVQIAPGTLFEFVLSEPFTVLAKP